MRIENVGMKPDLAGKPNQNTKGMNRLVRRM